MPGKVMLTEDYIIRMITTVLNALKRIVGLKTIGQYEEAQALIDQILGELLGMRPDLIKRLDDATLFASLTVQGKPDGRRMAAAGLLFQQEGEILAAQGHPEEAFQSSVRGLNFLLEASFSEMAPDADLHRAIDQLVGELQGYELPGDTSYSLFCYYEENGRYQQADDALKAMQSDPVERQAVMKERSSFYNRLLEKSDGELERGGISRLQVIEALNTILLHKSGEA